MKRPLTMIAILLAVGLLAVMIGQNITDAQRPGGRNQAAPAGAPRMGFGPEILLRGMSFDRSWMALSFELDTTDEQLIQARAAYLEARKEIQAQSEILREQMRGAGDDQNREQRREMMQKVMGTVRTQAKEIQASLDASLKEALTDEQYQKLVEIRTEDQKRMQQQMQGGGRQQPQGQQRMRPPQQ